jgi:hypothetical protein
MKRKTREDEEEAGRGTEATVKRQRNPRPTMPIRQTSMLILREHEGVSRQWLRPRIVVGADDEISQVLISRLTRTPSPFTGRMGDHTVSWQAIIDSVYARLHGLSVPAAVAALTARQQEIAKWMSDLQSAGRKMFMLLEDTPTRRPLLENAAYGADKRLTAAAAAIGDVRRASLEEAIAWHLAYLNYLPFATVPARSARGSQGSTEGTCRKKILAEEGKGLPAGPVLNTSEVAELRSALWGLFSFDAAIREAQVNLAVTPGVVKQISEDRTTLRDLASDCVAYADIILAGTPTRGKPVDGSPRTAPAKPDKSLTAIGKEAAPFATREEEYQEVTKLAQEVTQAADYMVQAGGQISMTGRYAKSTHVRVDSYKQKIGDALNKITQLRVDMNHQSDAACKNAGLVLGRLLHEHAITLAVAYPRAVTVSAFFGDSARDSAVAQLREEIEAEFPKADKGRLTELLDLAGEHYDLAGQPPTPAVRNGWVAGAATQELVITYEQGKPLGVGGRAPAPPGIGGMGSHVTAWVVERLAADALVSGARTADGAVRALQGSVTGDLGSDVMALDCLLPTDQLAGGQLESLFNAALAVLEATDVSTAATGYLTFRNLLPYATVDPGSRGSRGETTDGSQAETLDSGALRQAAELKDEELQDDKTLQAEEEEGSQSDEEAKKSDRLEPDWRRRESSAELDKAATWLADNGNPQWGIHESISVAVAICVARLREQALQQEAGPPEQHTVQSAIIDARTSEHATIYALSRKSQLTKQ